VRSALKALPAGCALALVALVAGGCGQTRIDVKKAAKFIDQAVQQRFGARVRSVVCPDKVKVKAGTTFSCVVTGRDGTTGRAKVTQRDDKGNMTVRTPFLQPRRAEQAIASELSKATPGTSVACQEIIVLAKGRRFSCEATAGGATHKISATQTDADGKFTYDLD
jgi:hypothetical protein